MRCIAAHQSTFMQGVTHERNVALRQITNAAVNQFSGSRGRAFGKIVRLEQQDFVAALRRIDRCAQSGRAAADHDHVPIIFFAQTL